MTKYSQKELERVKAWPFEEARKILKRLGNKAPEIGSKFADSEEV